MLEKGLSRRAFLKGTASFAGGLTAGVFLAACAAAPESGETAAQPVADTENTITLWFQRTEICRLCGAVDNWNEMHPETRVIDEDVAWTREKALATLAAGDGGPDLWQSDPQEVQMDMLGGKLLDLTDTIEPDQDLYLGYKVDQFRHPLNRKIYAFPWQVGVSVMYYRQDILEQLTGSPTVPEGFTWQDYETLAEQAKADLDAYTNWVGPGANPKDDNLFVQSVWQAGGSFISQDGKEVLLDSDICIDVADRLKRWWDKGLLYEGIFYSTPLWGAMREGILWATIDPSWWILGMRNVIATPEDHAGDWKLAPLPVIEPGGSRTANEGGGGLCAPAHTKNPELVREFGKFATTDLQGTVPTIKMGTVLAAKTSFTDPEVLDITFEPTGDQKVHELYAELVDEVPDTFYYSAGWPEVRHIVTQNLPKILKGEIGVEEGLMSMADEARTANARWVELLEQEPTS
jgi:multiple sugar transport system substrate-binding protein